MKYPVLGEDRLRPDIEQKVHLRLVVLGNGHPKYDSYMRLCAERSAFCVLVRAD